MLFCRLRFPYRVTDDHCIPISLLNAFLVSIDRVPAGPAYLFHITLLSFFSITFSYLAPHIPVDVDQDSHHS